MSYCLHSELGLLSGAGGGYNGAIGKAFGESHPSLNLFSIHSTICFFMFISNLGPDVSSKLSQWELNRLLPPYREICWSNWGSRLSLCLLFIHPYNSSCSRSKPNKNLLMLFGKTGNALLHFQSDIINRD